MEESFFSKELHQRVRELEDKALLSISNESKELILLGHAITTTGEAGHVFRQKIDVNLGVDAEIEFKDKQDQASGKRVYLQLKPDKYYDYVQEPDGKEVFEIKNPNHMKQWQMGDHPIMLVVRSAGGQICWMNITSYLSNHQGVTQRIIFEGEPFTALNVVQMRARLAKQAG